MIKRVTDADFGRYDEFIKSHKHGHFMQSLPWARFKSPQKSFALLCEDEAGNITGAMLLFVQKERRTGKTFLYSPRGPVCDREDGTALTELLSGARALAEEIGAYKLTLDPDITEKDEVWLSAFRNLGARVGENARDNGILQPFAVYRIDVDKTDDELMSSYHSKARYSVRTSIKSGATCRIGDRDDIPTFVRLLENTAEKDGFTARNEKYFYDMYDALGEDAIKIFIVEYEGEAIAGSVLLRYGKKTWHMYAGSSSEHKDVLPSFLMQWEMQRWSRDVGAPLYDMRGIAGAADKLKPIEGLVRFKKRFGGQLVSFVGRIDIIYNMKTDKLVRTIKGVETLARKLLGRK